MSQLIQRVPLGLQNALSITGGPNPNVLSDSVSGVLELIQFYGLTQRQQLIAQNGAVVEGASLSINLPASWCVLYALSGAAVKTATMTALGLRLNVARGGGTAQPIAYQEFQRFGATETGNAMVAHVSPYPLLLPPGSVLSCVLDILGTDANASMATQADVGVLG